MVAAPVVADLAAWLAAAAAEREARGLRRRVVPRRPEEGLLNLAGNDYLGLVRDPRVVQASAAAVQTWGTGSTGSRLVTGTTELHLELERALAAFCGFPAALVLSSGYAANLAAVTALSDSDTLLISDAANHASLIDACRLAAGSRVVVPHADADAVSAALATRTQRRAIVITESVFGADGDPAPLARLHAAARAHGALLLVDEAHGLGVAGPGGRGGVAAASLAGEPDVVVTVTLSKALASQGGAVLGSEAVREHISQCARTAIFDTALAPGSVAAALMALTVLASEPTRVLSMLAGAAALAGLAREAGFRVPTPGGAVIPVMLGDSARAEAAAATCLDSGVRVGCFRPPTVPPGTARLRLTARPGLDCADLERVRLALSRVR